MRQHRYRTFPALQPSLIDSGVWGCCVTDVRGVWHRINKIESVKPLRPVHHSIDTVNCLADRKRSMIRSAVCNWRQCRSRGQMCVSERRRQMCVCTWHRTASINWPQNIASRTRCRRQCFAVKSIGYEKGQAQYEFLWGMEPKPDPKSWSITSHAALVIPNRALLVMSYGFLPAASDFNSIKGYQLEGEVRPI